MTITTSTSHCCHLRRRGGPGAACLPALALLALVAPALADSLTVPNYSFEFQTAPATYPFVNTFIDSWQKAPEPGYYDAAIGTPFGIPWQGTAGVFLDVNPYANHVGSQAGYLLGFPQVELFQDYTTSATHDFNATFQVGKSYQFTLGVFGKNLAPGSTLQLGLYYLDGSNAKVIVDSTVISYSSGLFPTSGPLNLVDFSVNVPEVQATDAWANQHIGIQILSTTPIEMATGGNWDMDNARLTEAPEPASLALLALGVAAVLGRRRRG